MSAKYILIVGDDRDLVEPVAMMLESKGFEVGKLTTGSKGKKPLKNGVRTW